MESVFIFRYSSEAGSDIVCVAVLQGYADRAKLIEADEVYKYMRSINT